MKSKPTIEAPVKPKKPVDCMEQVQLPADFFKKAIVRIGFKRLSTAAQRRFNENAPLIEIPD